MESFMINRGKSSYRSRGVRFAKRLAATAAITGSLGCLTPASATVQVLTGGDPGEGYNPEVKTVYAYDTTGAGATIQGIFFKPLDYLTTDPPQVVSNTWGAAYTLATPSLGGSANDLAMASMLAGWFYYPGPGSLTLGGLTPGSTYQVDLFTIKQDASHIEQFTFNGGQTNFFTGTANVPYIITEKVAANSFGQIVVDQIYNVGGANNSVLSGFSITIPEPRTMLLLGLGGFLLRCRRGTR